VLGIGEVERLQLKNREILKHPRIKHHLNISWGKGKGCA
jgi:hypothetical protein